MCILSILDCYHNMQLCSKQTKLYILSTYISSTNIPSSKTDSSIGDSFDIKTCILVMVKLHISVGQIITVNSMSALGMNIMISL